MSSPDVFVIGGGPAGLAAAIAARRKGLDVTLADGARPPIDKPCGEGLMPDGLEALRRLGIPLDSADAFPFYGIRFVGPQSSVAARFPEGHALGVRRTVLHARMIEEAYAAGVRMLWGTPVSSLTGLNARWIVGADGFQSRVRRLAALDPRRFRHPRFGFRAHYHVTPWTDHMELYWGAGCQIYVTPVASREVCVAAISRDPHLRLETVLAQFPQLAPRLTGEHRVTVERGAVTGNCTLRRVYRGNVALVGDASGSVDAITGEGLCLSFRQAIALADALASGTLESYQREHRRIARRPMLMANLMLAMDQRTWLRERVLRALAPQPQIFRRMLALHVA